MKSKQFKQNKTLPNKKNNNKNKNIKETQAHRQAKHSFNFIITYRQEVSARGKTHRGRQKIVCVSSLSVCVIYIYFSCIFFFLLFDGLHVICQR